LIVINGSKVGLKPVGFTVKQRYKVVYFRHEAL
jgi:hypothetical protein